MKLLRCPALSPDLSLIENLREIPAKTVYDQETLLIENIVVVERKICMGGYSKRNFK